MSSVQSFTVDGETVSVGDVLYAPYVISRRVIAIKIDSIRAVSNEEAIAGISLANANPTPSDIAMFKLKKGQSLVLNKNKPLKNSSLYLNYEDAKQMHLDEMVARHKTVLDIKAELEVEIRNLTNNVPPDSWCITLNCGSIVPLVVIEEETLSEMESKRSDLESSNLIAYCTPNSPLVFIKNKLSKKITFLVRDKLTDCLLLCETANEIAEILNKFMLPSAWDLIVNAFGDEADEVFLSDNKISLAEVAKMYNSI
ncbi:hypothetical protein [Vibrio sp. D431a]|uniref:hypothetical protein n=1 Tax=Vibrio sp. D431a TaxID=2837388 RepID=UPI00255214C6|nr:hypothetical protein [Vibrio sp. D431a]MDK9793738.1 hypothetical protein [Vibrio sp. D431a]